MAYPNSMNALIAVNQRAKSNFNNLFSKLLKTSSKYRENYTRDDLRCGFFVIISQNILWLLLNIDTLFEMISNKNTNIDNYVLDLDEPVRSECFLSYSHVTRISFLVKMMFDIEEIMKRILIHFEQSPKKEYFAITEQFLKYFDCYSTHKHNILLFPAQIRNSLHNGGFTNYDIDITLRGKEFKAKSGEQIHCASWDDLYVAFDELFDLLIEIHTLPRIKDCRFISSKYQKTWELT